MTFRRSPTMMFPNEQAERLEANVLVLEVAPEEGVGLRLNAKSADPQRAVDSVDMRFDYRDYFDAFRAVGYEKLIHDCMVGDAMLFQSAAMVEAAWRAVTPFVDAPDTEPSFYAAGTDGPREAEALTSRDGRRWRPITGSDAR